MYINTEADCKIDNVILFRINGTRQEYDCKTREHNKTQSRIIII